MAINLSLNTLGTLNNTSILGQSNSNFTTIQNALPDALSRSGTSPNQMLSALDMNQNQIFNLPPPATTNSPARLLDVVSNPTITVPAVGTSGGTVPLLNTNVTWSGTVNFNNSVQFGAAGVANASLTLNGQTSGLSTISTNNTGNLFIFNPNGLLTLSCNPGSGTNLQMSGGTSGFSAIGVSATGAMSINGNGVSVQFSDAASFSANGSVAVTLTSLGPTGASTTVVKWLTIRDNTGTTRYIPCY